MPSSISDPSYWMKVLETVLCLVGVIMTHFVNTYYSTWTMHIIILGTGGFLLICSVVATSSLFEEFPFSSEIMFLSAGWILNLIGGCMVLVRYGLRFQKIKWVEVSSSLRRNESWELALGVTVLVLSLVMFVDFIIVIVTKRDADE